MLQKDLIRDVKTRLNTIKGQLEGIIKMLDNDKDPEQIRLQFKAAGKALENAELLRLDEAFRKSLAIESAGVILMGDRLEDVVNALVLGRASYRTLTSNVIIAVLFNLVGMVLAAFGLITPLMAIGVMILSIFAILLNTLRIRDIDLERPVEMKAEALAQVEFSVPDMMCEGCASTISTILKELSGVQEVKPKVTQKHVSVTYEPTKVGQEQLKEALEKSGFTAIEA